MLFFKRISDRSVSSSSRSSFGSSFAKSLAALLVCASPVAFTGTAMGRALEPNTLDPVKDAAYISTLGLATADWSDQIINILIVGQDAETVYHKGLKYVRPNGEQVDDMTSHADGNMLLSFNKRTGNVSIISLYRGHIIPDDKWLDVEDAPAVEPPNKMSNRYLANYYLFAGRAKYVAYVRSTFEEFIRTPKFEGKLERQYLTGGHLKIHGMVETGFGGFKAASAGFIDSFGSSMRIGFAMTRAAGVGGLASILANRAELMKELRSQPGYQAMTAKRKAELGDDPQRVLLGELREREKYEAGGYQRAFNHAKFISYVLGLVGYAMADAGVSDFLQEPAIVSTFNNLSHTFALNTFDQNVRRGGVHMIANTGFKNDLSPMYIIQVGRQVSSYAVYNNGRFQLSGVSDTKFVKDLKGDVELLPKPNNCSKCP